MSNHPTYTFTFGKTQSRGNSGTTVFIPAVETISVINNNKVVDRRVQDLRAISFAAEQSPPLDLTIQETILDTFEIKSFGTTEIKKSLRTKESYFSDMWHTVGIDGSIYTSFFFDEHKFLKDNSAFPVLFNIPRSMREFVDIEGTKASAVTSFRLLRRGVHDSKKTSTNSLGSGETLAPLSADTYLGELEGKEPPKAAGRFIRYTSVEVPDDLATVSSKIQYGIDISMIDETPKVIMGMYQMMLDHSRRLRELYFSIANPENIEEYDKKGRRFTKKMNNLSDTDLKRRISSTLDAARQSLNYVMIMISNHQDENPVDYPAVVREYFTSIYETKNPYGILKAAEHLENIGTKVLNAARGVMPGIAPTADGGSAGTKINASDVRPIQYKYYFSEIIDRSKDKGFSYRFLPTSDSDRRIGGVTILSGREYRQIAEQEAGKFFNLENLQLVVKPATRALIDPRTSAYSYLTPKAMAYPGNLGSDLENEIVFETPRQGEGNYGQKTRALAILLEYKRQKEQGQAGSYAASLPWVNYNNTTEEIPALLDRHLNDLGCDIIYAATNARPENIMNRSAITDFFGAPLQASLTLGERQALEDAQIAARIEDPSLNTPPAPRISSKLMMTLGLGIGMEGRREPKTKYLDKDFNSFSLDFRELSRNIDNQESLPPSAKAMIATNLVFDTEGDESASILSTIRLPSVNSNIVPPEKMPDEYKTYVETTLGVREGVDVFKDPLKFAALWLKYKQIVQVEVLTGFGIKLNSRRIPSGTDIGQSKWEKLTESIMDDNEHGMLFCRLRPVYGGVLESVLGMGDDDIFNLPIQDDYFVIDVGRVQDRPDNPERELVPVLSDRNQNELSNEVDDRGFNLEIQRG